MNVEDGLFRLLRRRLAMRPVAADRRDPLATAHAVEEELAQLGAVIELHDHRAALRARLLAPAVTSSAVSLAAGRTRWRARERPMHLFVARMVRA